MDKKVFRKVTVTLGSIRERDFQMREHLYNQVAQEVTLICQNFSVLPILSVVKYLKLMKGMKKLMEVTKVKKIYQG